MTTKETVLAVLDRLPDDCTLADVQYHLYVTQAIAAGENLTFDRNVTTRTTCADEMATDEAFVRVLEQVTRWRIIGQTLELSDGEGVVLARFEAS